ncbi:hypothetical protein STEG23_003124, partial [Scotinomys teguina]
YSCIDFETYKLKVAFHAALRVGLSITLPAWLALVRAFLESSLLSSRYIESL